MHELGDASIARMPARVRREGVLRLTTRQRELAALAAQGLCDKEIAATVGISLGTVRTHLHRAYMRNALSGRVALVVAWLRRVPA